MATLSRQSRHPPLHRGDAGRSFETSVNRSYMSARVMPVERTSLEQALKDLDISRSFVDNSDDSDCDPKKPQAASTASSTRSVPKTHPERIARCMQTESVARGMQTESVDPRRWVLSRIGDMMDCRVLDSGSVADAINLAMRLDGTMEAMQSLLLARPSLESQAVFLRMWLEKRKIDLSENVPLLKPKPERLNSSSWVDEIAAGINGQLPRGSPPLCPTALQFNDPVYYPVGLKRSSTVTPSSCSTTEPC